MKHLQIFENYAKNSYINSAVHDFFKNMSEYYRINNDSHAIDIMNFYAIPNEFEEEIKILFYLYSPSTWNKQWKSWDKQLNNSIKRIVKNIVHKQIQNKFNENPELCNILNNKFQNPKWIGNMLKGKVPDKYMIFAFRTAVKHSPDWMKEFSKYNL